MLFIPCKIMLSLKIEFTITNKWLTVTHYKPIINQLNEFTITIIINDPFSNQPINQHYS